MKTFLFSLYVQICYNVKFLLYKKYLYFNYSNFLCYMKFYIIWFSHAIQLVFNLYTRYCKSGITLLMRLIWHVFCIRFVWQINLIKKIIYMFRTQKRIKNPVKHLGWSYFCKKLHLRSLTRILNMPLEYLKFNVIKKINLPLT